MRNTEYLEFSHLLIMSIFRTEANPKYSGLDNNNPASFSNNMGYTFKLQASTQLTMLWSVLDHNSSTKITV